MAALRNTDLKPILLRAGAILSLFAAAVMAWTLLMAPWLNIHVNGADHIAESINVIARLKGIVALEPSMGQMTDDTRIAVFAKNFLAGTEDALIIAELQTKLRELVVRHNSQLNSARTLPQKSSGGLTYLGLKIELRGQLEDIHHIVYEIETAEPFLFIDKAHFHLSDQLKIVEQSSQSVIPQLAVELDIFGAKWPSAGDAPAMGVK